MFYFYVLYSLKDNKLYKGFSSDISQRFIKHNNGGTTSTKNRRPLILIYSEVFQTKKEAMDRERWSKSLEGGVHLKKILLEKNILDESHILKLSVAG